MACRSFRSGWGKHSRFNSAITYVYDIAVLLENTIDSIFQFAPAWQESLLVQGKSMSSFFSGAGTLETGFELMKKPFARHGVVLLWKPLSMCDCCLVVDIVGRLAALVLNLDFN